jgi:hypothetical protein
MAQSRIEAILENILGGENDILDPVSRNEMLLTQIVVQLENTPVEVISSSEVDEIVNTIN